VTPKDARLTFDGTRRPENEGAYRRVIVIPHQERPVQVKLDAPGFTP
jgi:hypothetical protein